MAAYPKTRMLVITQGNIDHASSRIRAVNYFPLFRQNGFAVRWIPRISPKYRSWPGRMVVFPALKRINWIRITGALLFSHYDLLFIQRHFLHPLLLHWVRWRKRKIIYDFDDALYIAAGDRHAFDKTAQMIGLADWVITGSPVLQTFALQFNARVKVITSPVKIDKTVARQPKSQVITIGWIGSEWTSKYLDQLEDVFLKLQETYPVAFLFVGCKAGVLSGIHPEIVPWSLKKEADFLSRMDIGIMPLDDGDFERGKGGYKLLQYMAAELPVIATPVGINSEIVEEGKTGFLCSTSQEWYDSFVQLIEDEALRNTMGKNGLQEILDKYSLEVCFAQWMALLQQIRDR